MTALFAGLICIAAPISIPTGAIPITLASLAVYITGAILPLQQALCAVAVYILVGAVGLPVFSNYSGGIQVILGPSGGYISGYLFCVLAEGLFLKLRNDKLIFYILAMLCGTVALYMCGTVWFCISAKVSFFSALSVCVLPFLPLDCIKTVAASALSFAVANRIVF